MVEIKSEENAEVTRVISIYRKFCRRKQTRRILIFFLGFFGVSFLILVTYCAYYRGSGVAPSAEDYTAILLCTIGLVLFVSLTVIYDLIQIVIVMHDEVASVRKSLFALRESEKSDTRDG